MARGKKTGGRQRGTPNKVNAETRAELARTGEVPLDYMLRVMRDESIDNDRRDRLAIAAAPFMHARLQSTALLGDADHPLVTEVVRVIVNTGVPRAGDSESSAGGTSDDDVLLQ